MRRHSLYFSRESIAALAALPPRRRVRLFNILDALALFPFDGETLSGDGRKEPIFARSFGEWRLVWWVDVPVFEIQVLSIESRGKQ